MDLKIFSQSNQLPFAMREMIVAPNCVTEKQPKWKTAGFKGQSLLVIPLARTMRENNNGIKVTAEEQHLPSPIFSLSFASTTKNNNNELFKKLKLSFLLHKSIKCKNIRRKMIENSKKEQSECTYFEPQNYLKDRCKRCFRLKDKHESNLPIRKPSLDKQQPSTNIIGNNNIANLSLANVKTTRIKSSNSKIVATNNSSASKNSDKNNSDKISDSNSTNALNNSANNSVTTKKQSPKTPKKLATNFANKTNCSNNKNSIPISTTTTIRRVPIQRSSSCLEKEEKNNFDNNIKIAKNVATTREVRKAEEEQKKQKVIKQKENKEENNKKIKEATENENNEILHENKEFEIKTIIMTPIPTKSNKNNKIETKELLNEKTLETTKTLATPKTSTSSSSSSSSSTTTTTVLLPKQRRQISQISGSKSFKEANNGLQNENNTGQEQKNNETEAFYNKNGNNFAIFVEEENNVCKEGNREDEIDDLNSLCSYKTAHSRLTNSSSPAYFPICVNNGNISNTQFQSEMFSAHSIDSLNSISLAESYKTLKSPPPFFDNDEDFLTPTSTIDGYFFNQNNFNFINQVEDNNNEEFDSRAKTPTDKPCDFDSLQLENQRLIEKCRRYKCERQRWTEWLARRATTLSGTTTPTNGKEGKLQIENNLNSLQQRKQRQQQLAVDALAELESIVNEYREENSALKSELQQQIKEQALNTHLSNKERQLTERLVTSELANDQLRQERDELQQEIDEIQDQCRMEEIEEFRELQRELDLNAKNCRILQFKLRKSERQREQLQAERCVLVSRCEELLEKNNKLNKEEKSEAFEIKEQKIEQISESNNLQQKYLQMEQEFNVAKQISIKLQNELEAAEERRCRLEDELFYNREKVRELLAQNKWREAKNSRETQQQNIRYNRGESLIISSAAALMVDGSSHISARPDHFEDEEENKEEIQREVRDSIEREADLREQLRFTEADLQRTRNRMRELETENDELLQKYKNMADQQVQNLSIPGGLFSPRRPSLSRSVSEGNDSKMLEATKNITVTQLSPSKSQRSASHSTEIREAKEIISASGKEDNTIVDTEQLCYMLAAMDAQANRICKQLEKLDGNGNKEERRRSLKGGEIATVMEELARLLSEMKAIKEQLAHSQNISLTKSMIVGNVLGDNNNANDNSGKLKEAEDAKLNGNNVCTVCDEKERKMREFEQSCDFYKRKNAELTEQVLQMRDQWAKELRKTEEEADAQKLARESEAENLRKVLDKQISEATTVQNLLENLKEENAAFCKAIAEREAELSQAKEKAGDSRLWESRCKEAKAERIRLQAELAQLRMRTDEALQELEKMRATHQQKEICWIREKLKLEDLLKQSQTQQQIQTQQQFPSSIERTIPVVVQLSKPSICCSPIKQLEKQNEKINNNNQQKECVRIDYKQIADNALRAAESLQRQYREYQSHYTAEVERLNARLNNLEREQQQKRLQSNEVEENALKQLKIQSFPTVGIQMNRVPMAESPSMSSLTENTTWDSRLLDCSMARSVSPFKFPRVNCNTPTSVKACRMDNNVLFRSQGAEKISGDFGSDEESTSAIAAAKAATKAHKEYRRTSSSGTNILYRIRREELSKGKCPSVRQMAKAFDSFEQTRESEKEAAAEEKRRRKGEKIASKTRQKSPKGTTPTRLFGILNKASSMDQSLSSAGRKLPPSKAKAKRRPSDHLATPLKSDGLLTKNNNNSGDIHPRGGRNPFKGMGSRFVERVRRSLSRTGKKRSNSRDEGTPLSISAVATIGNNEALISSTTTAASING